MIDGDCGYIDCVNRSLVTGKCSQYVCNHPYYKGSVTSQVYGSQDVNLFRPVLNEIRRISIDDSSFGILDKLNEIIDHINDIEKRK